MGSFRNYFLYRGDFGIKEFAIITCFSLINYHFLEFFLVLSASKIHPLRPFTLTAVFLLDISVHQLWTLARECIYLGCEFLNLEKW